MAMLQGSCHPVFYRAGFRPSGTIASSAATAPSANGPALVLPATTPPNGPPTATPRSQAEVTAPSAAVRSCGEAASVTRLVTLGMSSDRAGPAPAGATQ